MPFSGGGARGVTADDASQAQEVAASVPLPKGTSLITGRLSTDSDVKDKFAIAIDLCGSGIGDANALRPLATQIAKAYKASPLSDSIFALYVAHSTSYTDTDVTGQVKLKDADFATHLWNGKPSAAAEQQQWQVVGAA
ncbi:hypothetical protein [Gordonia malaquae]|uniref:hypothetical protein n=1 Tax=Gordonia malaquae TaxID=410332 RepID=UPI003015EA57